MKTLTAVVSLFLVLTVICGVLVSCKTEIDPFTEYHKYDADTGAAAVKADGLEDFYSLTMPESFEKYGFMGYSAYDTPRKQFDGKYLYLDVTVETETGSGKKTVKTLGRTEYPDGGYAKPVCTDPLCTHSPGSSCPFADYSGMFGIAAYNGKVYFSSKESELYVYDFNKNKSEIVIGKSEGRVTGIFKCENKLYIIVLSEDNDFNTTRAFYRIDGDSAPQRLCEYKGKIVSPCLLYKDRYVLSSGYDEIVTSDETYVNTTYILRTDVTMYDTESGDTVKVFERPCPEKDEYEDLSIDTSLCMLYGDKLLLQIRLNGHFDIDGKPEFARYEAWLVDLSNGAKRLLTYRNEEAYSSPVYLCSENMILVPEPAEAYGGHFAARLIDPYSGKETVFDLTDAAEKVGNKAFAEKMTEKCFLQRIDKGAIIVRRFWYTEYTYTDDDGVKRTGYQPNSADALLYDIESGRLYIYGAQ